MRRLTNKEFSEKTLLVYATLADIPSTLLTTRQASTFRMKKGIVFQMWKRYQMRQKGGSA